MIYYLKGIIEAISYDYVVIDVNGVAFQVYVSRPDEFSLYSETKLLTYMQVKEDDMVLYGFSSREEKELFLKIISVKGIGPKGAITMLSKATVASFTQDIETANTGFLKKLPGVGPKAAQQMILDLKGQLKFDEEKVPSKDNQMLSEAKDALKGLGFKSSEIDNALAKLNGQCTDLNDCIKKALQLLNNF